MKISVKKRLNKGKYSWFIHYYLGKTINANGGIKHIQEWETLGIYTIASPTTKEEEENNKILEMKAEKIFKNKELDFINKKNNLTPSKQDKRFTNSVENFEYSLNIILNNINKIPSEKINVFFEIINKEYYKRVEKRIEKLHADFIKKINSLENLINLKQNNITDKQFLTSKEACEYLSISYSKLTKLTKEKKIPFYKPTNGHMYFSKEEIDNWIVKQ